MREAARRRQDLELMIGEAPAVDAPASLQVNGAEAGRDIARYIGSLCGEMAGMARDNRMELLAYFLDMARLEARNAERTTRG